MNDDFLYKRQEVPEPSFVVRLHEELQSIGVEEKPKRKNGQRRFGWQQKLAAALFVFLVAGLVVFSQPKLREPLINIFIDDPNYDVLVDAYNRYGFELPTVPSRYEASPTVVYLRGRVEMLIIRWQASDHVCVIELGIEFDIIDEVSGIQIVPEPMIERIKTGFQLLGDISIMDGDNTNRIWASWTLSNRAFYKNYNYSLTTGRSCLSGDEITAIAQSTFSDNP